VVDEGASVEVTKITAATDSRETTNDQKNTTDLKEVTEIETQVERGDVNEEVGQSAESEGENAVIKRMVIRRAKTVRRILRLIQHSHVDGAVEQEAEKIGNLSSKINGFFFCLKK
jgi:hypothetical protein